MYLHGDGGSTVFVADTLDGDLLPPIHPPVNHEKF